MKRTLLIRPGAIGDAIVSLPAMEFLRGEYTEVWAPTVNLSLFSFADKVRSIASTGLERIGVFDEPIAEELRQFDRIVSWYGANREEFRKALQGLPVEFHRALPAADCSIHAVDFYLEQVGAPLGAVPRIPVSAEKRDFMAIHPFSGSVQKNWPWEKFQAVAGQSSLPVEWAAAPDGTHRFQNLGDVTVWLASARVYLGNDSGISHLAAAVGTPVIALFGQTDPRVWAPRGAAVKILRMDSATVAHVLDSIADETDFRALSTDCWLGDLRS